MELTQEHVYELLNVGTTLYHKYLSNISIIEVCEDRIKADTSSLAALEFAFYDFGKVLFFEKSHSTRTFESYIKYFEFFDEEKRLLEVKKREEEKLLKEQRFEKIRQVRIEQQRVLDEEKRENEQQSTISIVKPAINEVKPFHWEYTIDLNSIMERFHLKREALLKIRMDQEGKIREIIERRKIEFLVHFTRIDNLNSILKFGLIPISLQQKMNITSVHNDDQRIDSQLNCTSCSIGFPNYKLFYTFREYKFPGTRWAVIALDKEVLFSPSNIVYYCHTNAAGVFPQITSAKELCTADAFENMYCDTLITKENKLIHRTSLQISEYKTTDPQAELLISDVIDTKFIIGICFQNQRDIDEYISKNGKDIIGQFDYQITPFLFEPRNDYMFWKKEY